mmetsp:Transcript_3405/g.5966  ORF Transcript_3405/g.5966 Transcript_3405/m.5966 type:complete len:85 (-) Transcript_3405:1200-1454(-)
MRSIRNWNANMSAKGAAHAHLPKTNYRVEFHRRADDSPLLLLQFVPAKGMADAAIDLVLRKAIDRALHAFQTPSYVHDGSVFVE